MAAGLQSHAQRMYEQVSAIVRQVQFRDRDTICCHGLSVSQCYALEAMLASGPLTMGALAERLNLELSSVTRLIDGLVGDGLAERTRDDRDRRVCLVHATRRGRRLIEQIRGELIAQYVEVLRSVPAESRGDVVEAIERLRQAFASRTCASQSDECCEAAGA